MAAKIKGWLYGAAGLFVLLLLIAVVVQHFSIKDLEKDIVEKDATIKTQKEVIDKKTASDKVTESTNVELINNGIGRQTEQNQVIEDTKLEIDQIEKDFQMSEKDTSQEEARQKAISAARMKGLWRTYCNSTPDPVACMASETGDSK